MKSMKKLVTLLLSLVMLCALAMPAMAAETTYSITINRAVAGHTYTAYQVFKGVYYKGSRQNGTPEGLKEGTYYLEEITAPKGYNTLKDPVKVEIKASYNTDGTLNKNDVNFKLKQDDTKGNHYYQVQSIANKAGAVLPSTGGIGTTIFYVLGSILALGAAVLLIAKKRIPDREISGRQQHYLPLSGAR